MTTDILTQEFVQSAIEAEKNGIEFPIDFDDAWVASGYSRKGNAVRFLTERCDGLKFGIHYQFSDRRTASKGTPERIYVMTIDAFKFFLARCNTTQGDSALWYFIETEKVYRRSLESLFSAPSADRPNVDAVKDLECKLIQTKDVLNNFPISIDELQLTTKIVNKAQIKAAIVRDLEPIKDYVELDGKIYVTLSMYHILTMSFRSDAGTDISRLPEILKVQTLEYFRLQEKRRANERMGKRDKTSPGQIPLAL
jgi:hypothetical protein